MLKTLRRVKEAATVTGQDADDKKRLVEIREAASTLLRTLGYYYKTFLDHSANSAALHEDITNLYPANEKLSAAVLQLHASAGVFGEASAVVEALKGALEPPLNDVLNAVKDLSAKADERAIVRAEIEHYKEKVVRLANEGLKDAKKQNKAESNQEKLAENQQKFRQLDDDVTVALGALDAQIATLTNEALAAFMTIQSTYAANLARCYANAVAAIPGAVPPAAGAGAAAPAAGEAQPAAAVDAAAAALPASDFAAFTAGAAPAAEVASAPAAAAEPLAAAAVPAPEPAAESVVPPSAPAASGDSSVSNPFEDAAEAPPAAADASADV